MPGKKRGAGEKRVPLWKRISIGRVIMIILLVMLIFIVFSFFSLLAVVIVGPIPAGNIALIQITGTIRSGGSGYGSAVSAVDVVKWIEDADEDEQIQAILIDINSGGGSAVGSDEIAQAVKKAEKPTIAVIREVGASGAYWVASAADKIYVNRMSITGSIGVLGSYIEFAGLLEQYNMTYRRLVSGKYKDLGSPLKELDDEEELILQMALDKIHNFFIESVAENRNMSVDKVREIATGKFLLGIEALELGLVDELGTRNDAIEFIEKDLNITADLAYYRQRPSFYDVFSSFADKKISISFDSGAVMQT